MRKVFLFMMVTLDGFFEGPNQEIDWHNVDEEFNEFAIHQLNDVDMLLFGRVTYEGMASYWPTQGRRRGERERNLQKRTTRCCRKMNTIPKAVFSNTLEKAEWNNTRLIKEHIAEEVSKLNNSRARPGHIR